MVVLLFTILTFACSLLLTTGITISAKREKGPPPVQATGRWLWRKSWRVFIVGELNLVILAVMLHFLAQTAAFQPMVVDPFMFSVGWFFTLTVLLIAGVVRTYGYSSPIPGALTSGVEVYEYEVDSHRDSLAGIDYVLKYIREHERNPEEFVGLFLRHLSARDDEVGARAKTLLGQME
ncbi:MAG: hypothetical protein EAX95_16275 [Candidatus Thorarchaeota archaeon]|nr:hypothetical protein [Candidatus Thorarchaeota archaeon]